MQPIMLVVGTRPEGIKMVPVYKALKSAGVPTLLCSTFQHTDLLTSIFELFEVTPDFELDVMKEDQDLFYLTQTVLAKTREVFESARPSIVVVQGDTTSAMASALAAFYLKIPIAHVEAGLRTGDLYAPFPEEMNRCFISLIAAYHFAPTQAAAAQLLAQSIRRDTIYCTGNTVVDAMHSIQQSIAKGDIAVNQELKNIVTQAKSERKKIVLLTAHRRESFGDGLVAIFSAIKDTLMHYPDLLIIYPVHPNPAISKALDQSKLDNVANIMIREPLPYQDMVYLLNEVDGVATDSGGIQEEAISMGKQVMVLRQKTERLEGVWAGYSTLVGTDKEKIMSEFDALMSRKQKPALVHSIYGDGHAADRIVSILSEALGFVPMSKARYEKELR